ncbi:hypothetical protein LO762_08860 [Actinocorallia sp. API 0066]|uniref:hypothetical protein n=1 Tax=Actinocorallia sp. API 0066 TaxID=2896846 RepID=UPI001E425148|nr:hypothetical protein [Actinocorallia sp. API 0066]MCD0449296.1 hypothetical protein [Actinocorallia sp. API 0066]
MAFDVAASQEAAAGHALRVIGADGEWYAMTLDHDPDRVNLILEAGKIVWAGMC